MRAERGCCRAALLRQVLRPVLLLALLVVAPPWLARPAGAAPVPASEAPAPARALPPALADSPCPTGALVDPVFRDAALQALAGLVVNAPGKGKRDG